jgi:hypothetical protein
VRVGRAGAEAGRKAHAIATTAARPRMVSSRLFMGLFNHKAKRRTTPETLVFNEEAVFAYPAEKAQHFGEVFAHVGGQAVGLVDTGN